jgi:uracil-DNA glycosylase
MLARERGKLFPFANGLGLLVTIHPSAVLRMPDHAARQQAFTSLTEDLRQAVSLADALGRGDLGE